MLLRTNLIKESTNIMLDQTLIDITGPRETLTERIIQIHILSFPPSQCRVDRGGSLGSVPMRRDTGKVLFRSGRDYLLCVGDLVIPALGVATDRASAESGFLDCGI